MADRALFSEFLAKHRDGAADVELAMQFAEVCAAVGRTGKAGALVVTLKVTNDNGLLAILDTAKDKIPVDHDAAFYYVDPDGNVRRSVVPLPGLGVGDG